MLIIRAIPSYGKKLHKTHGLLQVLRTFISYGLPENQVSVTGSVGEAKTTQNKPYLPEGDIVINWMLPHPILALILYPPRSLIVCLIVTALLNMQFSYPPLSKDHVLQSGIMAHFNQTSCSESIISLPLACSWFPQSSDIPGPPIVPVHPSLMVHQALFYFHLLYLLTVECYIHLDNLLYYLCVCLPKLNSWVIGPENLNFKLFSVLHRCTPVCRISNPHKKYVNK